MGEHVRAMLDLKRRGAVAFDYGNNIRAEAQKAGVQDAFDFPGFVPAYIRPLFCEGKGPFRWAVLSGDPDDLAATDEAVLAHLPRGRGAPALDHAGARAGEVPGAARAHLLARLRRAREDGPRLQRAGAHGRGEGAHRDRPRPPRRGLGGLAQPRDRGHARRLRRGGRLAHPERAAERGGGRHLGLGPPRRRRGHGLLDPRRHGGGRRRHARRPRPASSACSPPTPAWASCATPTPATSARIEVARERGVRIPARPEMTSFEVPRPDLVALLRRARRAGRAVLSRARPAPARAAPAALGKRLEPEGCVASTSTSWRRHQPGPLRDRRPRRAARGPFARAARGHAVRGCSRPAASRGAEARRSFDSSARSTTRRVGPSRCCWTKPPRSARWPISRACGSCTSPSRGARGGARAPSSPPRSRPWRASSGRPFPPQIPASPDRGGAVRRAAAVGAGPGRPPLAPHCGLPSLRPRPVPVYSRG